MVFFRFPFSFTQPPKTPPPPISRPLFTAAALSISTAGALILHNPNTPFLQNALNFLLPNSIIPSSRWGSLSLSANTSPVTESRTGMSFPSLLGESHHLLGVGLRRKALLGLKNIDVYAFGVYADDCDVKEILCEKDGSMEDLMEADVGMTVRLQIVYGRLSIRSVRNAFEESVGSRLKKFGGSDNQELLQRFTSQFRDEYKIPRGSIIDMTREKGYVLRTIIDGEEVGSIQSKVLCKSILDLYIGGEPFDSKAKEDVERNLASLLGK